MEPIDQLELMVILALAIPYIPGPLAPFCLGRSSIVDNLDVPPLIILSVVNILQYKFFTTAL